MNNELVTVIMINTLISEGFGGFKSIDCGVFQLRSSWNLPA